MRKRSLPAGLLVLTLGCAAGPARHPAPAPGPAVADDVGPPSAPAAPRAGDPVAAVPEPAGEPVRFAGDVLPILEAGCRPCHFPGGQVYESMPFDREETVRRLGRRLFTRIEDEADRRAIEALLATPVAPPERR